MQNIKCCFDIKSKRNLKLKAGSARIFPLSPILFVLAIGEGFHTALDGEYRVIQWTMATFPEHLY